MQTNIFITLIFKAFILFLSTIVTKRHKINAISSSQISKNSFIPNHREIANANKKMSKQQIQKNRGIHLGLIVWFGRLSLNYNALEQRESAEFTHVNEHFRCRYKGLKRQDKQQITSCRPYHPYRPYHPCQACRRLFVVGQSPLLQS